MTAAKPGLVRELGFFSAFCVVAGSVIGSAVFLVASDISRAAPSPAQALSVWVVAGLLSLLGGLVFAELGAMYPGTGGQYIYLREAFGPLPAFLFGWTVFLVIQSGTIAAVAITCVHFGSVFVTLSPSGMNIAAAAVIVLLTTFNMLELKKGAWLLDALTTLKILALAAVALAGLLLPAHAPINPIAVAPWKASAYGVALIAAFWAYDGWSDLSYVAGEVRDPQRNIPISLAAGITVASVLYIGANWAYYRMLSVPVIVDSAFPAGEAARVMGGPWAAKMVGVAVTLSALGCANAMILAGPRVTYAMAEDGLLPTWLAYVHPRFRVPTYALLVQMAWSVILVWSGRYDQLFTYVMCAALIFYALAGCAVFVLRGSRPETPRPYHVPLYPYLPAFYILCMAAIVANTFREKPVEALAGLGIVALGLPFYWGMRASRRAAIDVRQSAS